MPALPPLLAFLPDIGGGEVMIVLFIVLLLFGGDKMPQLAKGLARALRDFKKAAGEVESEFKRALDEVPDPAPKKPAAFPPAPPPPVSRTGAPPAGTTPPAP
jgi:TatA/E family protein of Tat protein translocase